MKSTVNDTPLRGEAAWRAEKLAIAQRNNAACAKAERRARPPRRGRRELSAARPSAAIARRSCRSQPNR